MLAPPPILKHLTTVADPTRCRALRLLEQQELTVGELCAVLQLPQSTVSRHLKTLSEGGWIAARRDGTSHFYALDGAGLSPDALQIWKVVGGELGAAPAAREDERRLAEVLAERRSRSREFFSSAAGQWDRLRDELFGSQFHLQSLPGFLDSTWVVGDLGCGTGPVSAAVAPFVERVIAVDGSAEMLQSARERLGGLANVEIRPGDLEALPIGSGELDAAMLMLVLHHLPDPQRAVAEAARVVRPGGRLLVVDMLPHERQEYRLQMGHVWLGFDETQVRRSLAAAGFEGIRFHALPADPAAKGPGLFAAAAGRSRSPA